MVQIGYSEVKSEEFQRWACTVCGSGPVPTVITIDIETVSVQDVGTQSGDTIGQLGHFLIQLLSIQRRTHRVMMVGANTIYSSGCSILF